MPQFEIHDDHTGLKLLVEGPAEPTYDETVRLFNDELAFLKTNLYRGPEGRFMLDVGPSGEMRKHTDKMTSMLSEYDDLIAESARVKGAIDRAHARLKTAIALGEVETSGIPGLWKTMLDNELSSTPKAPPIKPAPTMTEQTFGKLAPNTLLIISHGKERGGLQTEGGQDFQMNNISQVLGAASNQVYNVINTACYGGKCLPADYQSAFPNVTNVQHADLNVKNTISIARLASGDFFYTNTVPGLWTRHGTNWFDVETVPQEPAIKTAIDEEP